MTVVLKRNVPGYVDELGRFRPIRSASYVGSKAKPRKAKASDRRKYSRTKAGDLGKARQARALEDPWDRDARLEREAKAREKREQDRITRELEREIYGETSGRTSRGKGQTLAQFIRSEGGINTTKKVRKGRVRYGDSLENFTRKGSGSTGLVTTTPGKGKSLDYMHQAAREAGFDLDSMDDLLDALDNEIRSGKKTYSTHGSMTYNPRKTKNPSIAQTILQQLGGSKFAAMTGAKTFANTGNGLRFRLPANFASGGINLVTISLNGRDLYDVEFGKLRGSKYAVVKIDKNIYADMLRDLFTQRTGLDTSLGTMGRKNPIRVLKHKFYVGQKLATRSIGDHEVIYRGTVVSRTPKFVTVKVEGYRDPKRCGVKLHGGSEYIFPLGSYSMAPVFRAEKGERVGNPKAKKNPDLLGMFANAAVGIASTLQIHEMTKTRKRKAAPKKRGTTKAKARKAANPASSVASKYYSCANCGHPANFHSTRERHCNVKGCECSFYEAKYGRRSAKTNPSQPNLFKSNKHGDLYVLTIGSGDDLISVYLHDGDKDGFSKRFKTMAAAKAYASRNKVKLVQNPAAAKINGIIKRAWARSRAASEYRRELRLEAAAERARKRRSKFESAAKNPAKRKTKSVKRKTANPSALKWVREKSKSGDILYTAYRGKDVIACLDRSTSGKWFVTSLIKQIQIPNRSGFVSVVAAKKYVATKFSKVREYNVPVPKSAMKSVIMRWESGVRENPPKLKPAAKRRNPKSTARRRTFEMFQGRKVTTARPMIVSNHAPANLDQLGDLIELKIAGGPTLKFNGKTAKLCAANGKLWIAGKRFAKPNPAAKANELNPIGEIDHVVYGTRKPHHGDHAYTHYIHKLGEESGKRPILCVDREGFPVFRGGNYKIEARGIVD